MCLATKWYFRGWFVIITIILLGPFAIPLVWKNPTIKRSHKVVIICALFLITIWMIAISFDMARLIVEDAKKIEEILSIQ